MKTLPFLLRSAAALLALPTFLLAQGSLTPPGAPSATMRSLEQIGAQLDNMEAGRIAVNAANTPGDAAAVHVINRPGSFYLTTDISISGNQNGVLITSSGVTLDLNGHRITADELGGTGYGVKIEVSSSPARAIVIRNGSIMDCGGGVYAENVKQVKIEHLQVNGVTGYGVFINGTDPVVSASHVEVIGASTYGILLAGDSTAENCWVTNLTHAQIGIETRIARDCGVRNIKGEIANIVGIMANTAENCTATDVACTTSAGSMVWGIYTGNARGCYVYTIGSTSAVNTYGIGGGGATLENCTAASISGRNPYGIRAEGGIVRGCTIASVTAVTGSTEGYGIYGATVENCTVTSINSPNPCGVYAESGVVSGCKVKSVTAATGSTEGYGIRAGVVQGCTVELLTSASTIQGVRGEKVADCEVGDITGVSPSGIVSLAGATRCYVRAITATAGTTYGYGINAQAGTVSECTVNALHCASGQMYGILGTIVRDCRLSSHGLDAADTATHYGIATSLPGYTTSLASIAERNSLQGIRNVGIYLGQGSAARGNAIFDVGNVTGVNDGKAIAGVAGCRIEGNTIGGNMPDYGIFVTGTGSLIIDNQCTGIFTGTLTGSGGVDTGAYNIAANNRYGPIVIGNGVIAATVEGTNFAN